MTKGSSGKSGKKPEGKHANASMRMPAFLFDLDGTLVDSVYQHVLAWREALERGGIELSVWRIHRRIGMSGGSLSTRFCARRAGRSARRKPSVCRSCTPGRFANA